MADIGPLTVDVRASVGPYILKVPGNPSPELRARLREQVQEALNGSTERIIVLGDGMELRPVWAAPAEIQMDRLLNLLDLTEQERAFVRESLEPDCDRSLFAVLADYLEEKNNSSAGRFRAMANMDIPNPETEG